MQGRSNKKPIVNQNKQTNNLPFCMPVGGCRCLFRKKHQGNSCKREEQEENNAPFAQTRKRFVPPLPPPPPVLALAKNAAGNVMLHRLIFRAFSRKK
jgi:hypothetical protein